MNGQGWNGDSIKRCLGCEFESLTSILRTHKKSQAWRHLLVTPALERRWQVESLSANLTELASSRPVRDPVSKKQDGW